MARRVLIVLFALSALLETVVALAVFFAPEKAAAAFAITPSPEIERLSYLTGWLVVFLAVVCWIVLYQLVKAPERARPLVIALGACWACLGIAMLVKQGDPQYLIIDSTRGVLMVLLGVRLRG